MPQSKTVILFIHGILGTPCHFADFIKRVPEQISVHNILLDGHGETFREFSKSSLSLWKQTVFLKLSRLSMHYENIIIVAHSLGALLAMDFAPHFHDKIRQLFLIAVPLKIALRPPAVFNSFKVMLNRVHPCDKIAAAAKAACSIAPTKNPCKHIAGIPRYLELFSEARRARSAAGSLSLKTVVFQSGRDEIVSMKSCGYLRNNPNVSVRVLPKSMHYYYDETEYKEMIEHFEKTIAPFCSPI
ncbi:MAG TPA: alpha/beta hydrolase [Clostridia bacterium]|nr:alpha/beta hydrolase [Clostridia bacterium]